MGIYLEYSRVQVHLTLSHASAMIQVGLRVPTPFAERSQASCEFLAHASSRSMPCTGFQFLLSAQACEHLVAAIDLDLCVCVSGADPGGGGGMGGSCPPPPPPPPFQLSDSACNNKFIHPTACVADSRTSTSHTSCIYDSSIDS